VIQPSQPVGDGEGRDRSRISPATGVLQVDGYGGREIIVWHIERHLAEAAFRPVIFYPAGAGCRQPRLKGLTSSRPRSISLRLVRRPTTG
jgi:hypothetical protein